MAFAARGRGKTYFALALALAVTRGENKFLGHYPTRGKRRVLYIDGELPLRDLYERLHKMDPSAPPELGFLSSEDLFRAGETLNLHDADTQGEIDAMLKKITRCGKKPDLIILDSLSTLSAGADENDNSQLDGLIQWLMRLRHGGYSVLLLHHTGKNGEQRGASRREDYLDTSIKLATPKTEIPHDGAHFVLEFTKTRDRRPNPDQLECKLEQQADGPLAFTTSEAGPGAPKRVEVLRAIANNPGTTQQALAGTLGRHKSGISNHCRELRKRGLLAPGRELQLTDAGWDELAKHYPEYAQRDLPM